MQNGKPPLQICSANLNPHSDGPATREPILVTSLSRFATSYCQAPNAPCIPLEKGNLGYNTMCTFVFLPSLFFLKKDAVEKARFRA